MNAERFLELIRHGEYLFYQMKPRGVPTPHELIWLLLKDAMNTVRRTPFDEMRKVSKIKSMMPEARTSPQEAYEIELTRLVNGMSQYDRRNVNPVVTAADVDRMVDILEMMRFVTGRDEKRLRKTILAWASGLTVEQCAYIWNPDQTDMDRRKLSYLKQRALGQILVGVEKAYGLKRTGRAFRRKETREIERG